MPINNKFLMIFAAIKMTLTASTETKKNQLIEVNTNEGIQNRLNSLTVNRLTKLNPATTHFVAVWHPDLGISKHPRKPVNMFGRNF